MNTNHCPDVRTLLNPYLDSELDAKTSLEISLHLKECPACAAHLAEEAAWQQKLKATLAQGPVSEGLWRSIEERVRESVRPRLAAAAPQDACPTRHWRYWLWPSPRLYVGLAAAWGLILTVQVGTREPGRGEVVSTPETRAALIEQRHLLAELLGNSAPAIEPAGTQLPPQTDARDPEGQGALWPLSASPELLG